MRSKELLTEFYDASHDEIMQVDYDDTRRPRLTLSQIHRMRKARDAERVDKKQYNEFLPSMYNQSEE